MRTTNLRVLLRVFLAAGILFAVHASAQERAAVPGSSALEAAQKTARELYGKRFTQAKTAAEKTAVAKEMLEAGDSLPKGSADQYAVWKIARDVATGAGDVATALDAADKLAERFDLPVAKTKAETLLAARRQVNRSTQHKALAEAALKVLPALIAAEDYDAAASLVEAARASAQTAREYSLVKAISARADEIKTQQKASQGYRDALAVLKDKPTDPEANLAAGSYLCFVKVDWDRGVPLLAQCSDAKLQAVAAKDQKGAESPEAQLALGDQWWALAEARQGREKEPLMLRAGFWYGQAEPQLAAGLARVKVQKRLAEIAKLDQPTPAAKERPSSHDEPSGKERPPLADVPFDETQAKAHQLRWSKYLKVPTETTNSLGMKFVFVPPGEFMMGSTPAEIEEALKSVGDNKAWQDGIKSEGPQHKVTITQPFYVGVHEVTQAQYAKVMGRNPSHFAAKESERNASDTSARPVEQASWNDAVEFCVRLSQMERLKPFMFEPRAGKVVRSQGTGYRLPTEAEWEFACRAGTTTKCWIGDKDDDLRQAGWFNANSGGRTHDVGELKPNPFGLFDMHGNVFEWVYDGWEPTYYGQSQGKSARDPDGPSAVVPLRMLRGGTWWDGAYACRASTRHARDWAARDQLIGFRVVLAVGASRVGRP